MAEPASNSCAAARYICSVSGAFTKSAGEPNFIRPLHLLQAAGMQQSMSRKGCCYDNAPMESFVHTLKVELVHRTRFETRDQARREVFAYIETYDNRQRAHSAIGDITPEQAELRSA